jgi:hypothetical protein
MSRTVHLHLSLQEMSAGRFAATIRREDTGVPYGLTRAFTSRVDAQRWLVENAKAELSESEHGEAA